MDINIGAVKPPYYLPKEKRKALEAKQRYFQQHAPLLVHIGYLKQLFKLRAGWIMPDEEDSLVLIEQFLLRHKIIMQSLGPKAAKKQKQSAIRYARKFASWYDFGAFPWEHDNLKLMNGRELGDALNLAAREWYEISTPQAGMKPVDFDPWVVGQVGQQQTQVEKNRLARKQTNRDEKQAKLQKEVQQFLKQGQTHKGIAGIFNTQRRRNASGRRVDWTERMLFGLDPDFDATAHKREMAALRKQKERDEYDMTKREWKVIENDTVRDYIRSLYDDGNGYGTIANILNERGIATRTGIGKWSRNMVKREVMAVLRCTQNVTLSDNQKHNVINAAKDASSAARRPLSDAELPF